MGVTGGIHPTSTEPARLCRYKLLHAANENKIQLFSACSIKVKPSSAAKKEREKRKLQWNVREESRWSPCWLPGLSESLPLKPCNAASTIQSATVTVAERHTGLTVILFFVMRNWHFKPCQVFFHPSCVFGTSRTSITRLSRPLVTFLCRSFPSWSRLISTTVFGTSWTTLFLPSTSCINSSSTPV